jgi:Protein of unknown function (DUF3500)
MESAHNRSHSMHHHHGRSYKTRRKFISLLLAAGGFGRWALGQTKNPISIAEGFRRQSEEAMKAGIAEPFTGITTNGKVVPNLFEIHPTGVSTETVRGAALRFIASLNSQQIIRTLYPVDDVQWREWMNQSFYARQGVSFREMTDAQRDGAFDLMRASLSQRGFDLMRNIMRLNETLADLTNDHLILGEWAYHVTIMGQPSATDPWGWQFQGHHGVINYFVLGDQVVMTPLFVGAEPTHADSGKYQGLEILQKEQNAALTFVQALPASQQKQAILNASKTGINNQAEAFRDNAVVDYAGLKATELTANLRPSLRGLIQNFVSILDEGHARIKMEEVDQHFENTWFAWIGGTQPDSVFYYRIQSPVILIEFDHQPPFNLQKFAAGSTKPTRGHIHCVVRTPNGNDYGKDLLRQYYQSHPHTA